MAPKEANLANELDPSLNFIACDIMVCTHKESQLTRINVLYPNGGMYWFTSFLLYTSHVHHQQVFYEISTECPMLLWRFEPLLSFQS